MTCIHLSSSDFTLWEYSEYVILPFDKINWILWLSNKFNIKGEIDEKEYIAFKSNKYYWTYIFLVR